MLRHNVVRSKKVTNLVGVDAQISTPTMALFCFFLIDLAKGQFPYFSTGPPYPGSFSFKYPKQFKSYKAFCLTL